MFFRVRSAHRSLCWRKAAFQLEGPGNYFVAGNFTYDKTGEYLREFSVIAGVITTDRFLQRVQAASRDTL